MWKLVAYCNPTCTGSLTAVILAEMDVWHSRSAVPTRRVALGEDRLRFDPPPGPGGLLLAAMVAFYGANLADEARLALNELSRQLERGDRVTQPRLRYRLQQDRVGLTNTKHRLVVAPSGDICVDLDRNARSEPQLLAAMYRASRVPEPARSSLFILLRSAMRWRTDAEPDQVDLADMMAYLTGRETRELSDRDSSDMVAKSWALHVMGMDTYDGNTRSLQRQFRRQMREAHPDHGGEVSDAGDRIAALTAARKILLSNHASFMAPAHGPATSADDTKR